MKILFITMVLFISTTLGASDYPWRLGKFVDPVYVWGLRATHDWNNFYIGDLSLKILRGNQVEDSEAERSGDLIRFQGVVYANLTSRQYNKDKWTGIPVEYSLWFKKNVANLLNEGSKADIKVMTAVANAVQVEYKAVHFLVNPGLGWGERNKTQIDPEQVLYYNLYLQVCEALNKNLKETGNTTSGGSIFHHGYFKTVGTMTVVGKLSPEVVAINGGVAK